MTGGKHAQMVSRVLAALGAGLLAVAMAVPVGLVGSGPAGAATRTSDPHTTALHAVGSETETFVDTSRPTAANGTAPALPQRTLVTTILYPATGTAGTGAPVAGAPPDKSGAPYPMIVFAHGTGATPQGYLPLLQHWAAAGFVVVAPKFPLSSGGAPGGVDVGDVVNQPADMSFVTTSVLHEVQGSGSVLSGMVDPDEIGAAGHSLGAITTLGMVANTCCKDARVKAAVVMAGTAEGYPGGHYELGKAPPMLVVSGTNDSLVPYNDAVGVFNAAKGPKALLTIKGGDHDAAAGFSPSSQATVYRTTTDFFDAYLRDSSAARSDLAHDAGPGTKLLVVSKQGATTTAPTLPVPKLHLRATVTPRTNLTNGQVVTVKWSGYTPGKAVTILECGPGDRQLANSSACDFTNGLLLKPNPTGKGTLPLTIVEGKVGTDTCDAAHPGCFVLIDNASSSVPSRNVFVPITFAK